MKLSLIIAFSIIFCHSLLAQTTLSAELHSRIQSPLLGGGARVSLEPGKKYIVMGFDRENHPLIQHEKGIVIGSSNYGTIDNSPSYEIINEGAFSDSVPLPISKSSIFITSNPSDHNHTFACGIYEADLPVLMPGLYVAFQISVDGVKYPAVAKAVTSKHIILPVRLDHVPFSTKIASDVRYYINGKEIKNLSNPHFYFNGKETERW